MTIFGAGRRTATAKRPNYSRIVPSTIEGWNGQVLRGIGGEIEAFAPVQKDGPGRLAEGSGEQGIEMESQRQLIGGGKRPQRPVSQPSRHPSQGVRMDLELCRDIRPAPGRLLPPHGVEQKQPVEHVLQPESGAR